MTRLFVPVVVVALALAAPATAQTGRRATEEESEAFEDEDDLAGFLAVVYSAQQAAELIILALFGRIVLESGGLYAGPSQPEEGTSYGDLAIAVLAGTLHAVSAPRAVVRRLECVRAGWAARRPETVLPPRRCCRRRPR